MKFPGKLSRGFSSRHNPVSTTHNRGTAVSASQSSASEPALLIDGDPIVCKKPVSTLDRIPGRLGIRPASVFKKGGNNLLRFTEEDVFPPVRTLVHSHCMTTSEFCIPQLEHSKLKAFPL